MLRLKQALTDCNIQQKALIAATGFGKSQISQTLSSGVLPANIEKFRQGVYKLCRETPILNEWLDQHNLNVDDLFLNTALPAAEAVPAPPSDFDSQLIALTGKTILGALNRVDVIQLCRAANFLADAVRYHAGQSAPGVISDAAGILAAAGTPP